MAASSDQQLRQSAKEASDAARKAKAMDAARRLLEKDFERLGSRYQQGVEQQFELLKERAEKEEMWRLCGLGEPPEFEPSVRLVRAG